MEALVGVVLVEEVVEAEGMADAEVLVVEVGVEAEVLMKGLQQKYAVTL